MKKYCKITFLWVLPFCVLLGCKKMDDNYRQFFEDGETIYIGRADSVVIRGGDQRIEVSWLLLSDPKVNSYKLYWNNYQDSVISEVEKTSNIDTVKVLLNNMVEGLHHFEIIMYDKLGNYSVPTRVSGRAYGEQYNSYLVNRIFKEPRILEGIGLQLNWVPAEDELLFSEIQYEDINGKDIRHIVNRETEVDTLKGFPVAGSFDVISAFKPDSLALDTFYSKIEKMTPL